MLGAIPAGPQQFSYAGRTDEQLLERPFGGKSTTENYTGFQHGTMHSQKIRFIPTRMRGDQTASRLIPECFQESLARE